MNQTKLSFTPTPAAHGSDTSNEAAVKATESGKHSWRQAQVLWALDSPRSGRTDEEITDLIAGLRSPVRHSSIVSARNSLVKRGLVEDSGNRRLSPTSGMRVTVWRCVR